MYQPLSVWNVQPFVAAIEMSEKVYKQYSRKHDEDWNVARLYPIRIPCERWVETPSDAEEKEVLFGVG